MVDVVTNSAQTTPIRYAFKFFPGENPGNMDTPNIVAGARGYAEIERMQCRDFIDNRVEKRVCMFPTWQIKTGRGRRLVSSCFYIQVCPLRLSMCSAFNISSIMCALIALTHQYSYPLAAHSWRSQAYIARWQSALIVWHYTQGILRCML